MVCSNHVWSTLAEFPIFEPASLWDYIRRLEQSEDLEPRFPLRYDIGNWLGHFHNWGSEEQVVEKLQGIVRNQELTNNHFKFISKELNMAIFEELNKHIHQLPKHAHKTLEKALGLIRENYAIPEKQQSFQILNGNFDLPSLHFMDSPLAKLFNPEQSPSVYVSEWRDCREGHPAFDLGPFMADLVVLYEQNTTIAGAVARGFVDGYFDKVRENRDPGNKFIFHVLVHIGVCMIIRCRGLSQKKNDYSTRKHKNTGEDNNIGEDESTVNDENNGKVKNTNGNRNGTPADNDNNDPNHRTNGTNENRRILNYGLLIVHHALSEDSEWFLDKPLLCHLFGLSSASSSKGHSGPDRWELANKSSTAKKKTNPPFFRSCFQKFISAKCIKQIGLLNKDVRSSSSQSLSAYHSTQKNSGPPQASSRRYLLGLSLGPSSAALLELLNENVEFQLSRGKNAPFELEVVHVSGVDEKDEKGREKVEDAVQMLRERYSRFEFRVVYLEEVVGLGSVDWEGLGLPDFATASSSSSSSSSSTTENKNENRTGSGSDSSRTTTTTTKAERLRQLFDNLPSATSRTDLLRLFTRHLLIAEARKSQNQCHALLLGSSTTALAELTLSETAKGRGFSLPWQINDGVLGVPSFNSSSPSSAAGKTKTEDQGILIYHPLRDALRKELVTFTKLVGEPTPIFDLLPETDPSVTAAVVSHKDLSIEEVMVRYFADVEENYPSIVANVARTTGKLMRLFGGGGEEGGMVEGEGKDASEEEDKDDKERLCGLCSMPLDEFGDERWKGELGEDSYRDTVVVGDEGEKKMPTKQRICYGCERSIQG
ncbi:hypothetical protein QBC45DRAFT_326321 [Copromyces sp. CBS 386.78]|nr:hypothetical protein QBC45DRAFT_326321 [Copromyces sp. CBS 386.78]